MAYIKEIIKLSNAVREIEAEGPLRATAEKYLEEEKLSVPEAKKKIAKDAKVLIDINPVGAVDELRDKKIIGFET